GNAIEIALIVAWNLLMTAATGLIAWRLWFGMLDKMRFHETSFILQIPVWMFYAACIPPALVAVAAGLVAAIRDARQEAPAS
ncbi:MAG: TRAP transporter small permease subunit, partial [Flavobacteriaceae bacterium]